MGEELYKGEIRRGVKEIIIDRLNREKEMDSEEVKDIAAILNTGRN